jgi:predicted amidophosphoribosyltransferase
MRLGRFIQGGMGIPNSPIQPGKLLAALLPATCILCGAPGAGGRDLCAGCAADLPHNLNACPRCALPLDTPLPAGAACGTCQRRRPHFARAIAALRYETPIPTLVGGVKFRGRLNAARVLGQLLADAVLAQTTALPQALLPVPLHPKRLAERGYNQSLEIARVVGSTLGLPVATQGCRRALATPPQAGLDARTPPQYPRGIRRRIALPVDARRDPR